MLTSCDLILERLEGFLAPSIKAIVTVRIWLTLARELLRVKAASSELVSFFSLGISWSLDSSFFYRREERLVSGIYRGGHV